MAKLALVRVGGALILSTALLGCASTLDRQQPGATESKVTHKVTQRVNEQSEQQRAKRDRTPSWQKYQVSGSRIARRLDANGKPMSADFVQSTTSKGLEMLPGVTMIPCSSHRGGC